MSLNNKKQKAQYAILFFIALPALLLFFQNCDSVKINRLSSTSAIAQAKFISGTFCQSFDKNIVSSYQLSNFYIINLTANKFNGELFPDNDLDGSVDRETDYSNKTNVTVSNTDSDSDGIPDFIELLKGLNPNSDDANRDGIDLDGVLNARELQLGTDPNFKGDSPTISYTIKTSDETDGCGGGQQAYSFEIQNINLVHTKRFTDSVNVSINSLSHEDEENIILVLAKMSPEDTNKPSVFMAKLFKINALHPESSSFSPTEFFVLGAASDNCPSCNNAPTGNVYTKIYASTQHACALSDKNSVICWGNNAYGQLGDATNDNRVTPVKIKLNEQVSQMALGSNHTCAVTFGNDVYCWGANNFGQLGNNATMDSSTPVKVDLGSEKAILISAGVGHSCAVLQSNTIKCWGRNEVYQLADGTTAQSLTPVLTNATGVTFPISKISSSVNNTCLVDNSGKSFCWGGINGCVQNSVQKVPTTCVSGKKYPEQGISKTASWSTIVTNGYAISGVDRTANGNLTCWTNTIFSSGQYGCGEQVDGGGTGDPPVPTEFTDGIIRVTKVTMSINHSCAISQKQRTSGELYNVLDCWGDNSYGALAQSLDTSKNTIPMTVTEVLEPKDVASGNGFTCAIDKLGEIWCWGLNTYGQLGSGDIVNDYLPKKVKNQ